MGRLQQDVHDLAEYLAPERHNLLFRREDCPVKLLTQLIFQDPEAVLWRPNYVVFATPIYM